MSIEELLKDNNDMLKQLLYQLGNNNNTNNNEGLKQKQSYIDNLPDATMSATITEDEDSNNNQEGGNIKKIRLRRGSNNFKIDPNKLGGDLSTKYPDDIENDEEIDEEIDEEFFDINTKKPTKIGGNKPPKVLKILSVKTDKKKSKKSKKSKKIKKSVLNKTKTTSNKTKTTPNKTKKNSGKKTLTGYQLFMKKQMPIWKKKNPKKTHKEAFSAVAKLWKLEKKN